MLDYLFRAPSIFQVRDARSRLINNGEIIIEGTGYISLENGDMWRRRRTRGVARHVHAWFFYYLLRPLDDLNDEEIARKLIRLLRAWRDIVGLPPTRIPMAYHDEATAQRAIALSCMLEDYSHLFTRHDISFIRQILAESAELLVHEEFHSQGTNHGMYQDLSLIMLSDHVPDGERYLATAIKRLDDYFLHAFTPDGIHNEQSPQYHCIVSNHLREYVNFRSAHDTATAQQLWEILEKTEKYATMAITPLGKFPPVSDTANALVTSLGYSHIYPSPEFQYAITQGLLGTPPSNNQYIAADTGVAIYREDWRDPNSVYLYFSSAYNSDYHKHSDELSLYLVHRGVEVLREAGPNGYEMQDPYTAYAFSSFAHNTLIVNDEGLARTDPIAMDRVGIKNIAEEDGNPEEQHHVSVDFTVEGWNYRYAGVQHRRRLDYCGHKIQDRPKRLRILDEITSNSTNEYQLLWHFGPEVTAELQNDIVCIRNSNGVAIAELSVSCDTTIDLTIVSGQPEPQVQGWYFPQMGVCEPAQTLILSFTKDHAEVQTDISLV